MLLSLLSEGLSWGQNFCSKDSYEISRNQQPPRGRDIAAAVCFIRYVLKNSFKNIYEGVERDDTDEVLYLYTAIWKVGAVYCFTILLLR